MTKEELQKEDHSFNESGFISKVDNVFIMLHSAIMLGNLDRVKHKLSNQLILQYQKLIDNLNKQNIRQMYDEINVKSTEIQSINKLEDKYVIKVLLISRYMDYTIDKVTGKYVNGINDHRITKNNIMIFTKQININKEDIARKCPGCGANINANYSGKCDYCGTIYDTEKYDWILEEIETTNY